MIQSRATLETSPPGGTARVFVVDDDISVRESLELLLEAAGREVISFACAADFMDHRRTAAPSCVVLDIGLPDINGLDLQDRFAASLTTTPVVFISGRADVPMAVRAIKGGAVELLTKPLHGDTLLEAVERALEASAERLRREARVAALDARHSALTPREHEVMAGVVLGRLNKQVGADLGISEITVKAHRGSLMRKMKARSLPELVKMAVELGIGA
jgi:FixJ family two-component response regulator